MAENYLQPIPNPELRGPEAAREALRQAVENKDKNLPPIGTQGELLPRSAGRSPEAKRMIEEARAKLRAINEGKNPPAA